MDTVKRHAAEDDDDAMININSLAHGDASEDERKMLLELQLAMATSSINHEYARVEFEDANDMEQKEELLQYMHDCRCKYFEARSELIAYDPYALADFEVDLMRQKQMTLNQYNA